MALNQNMFAMEPVAGQLDLEWPGSVIAAQAVSTQATALVAGQAVKLSTVAGGLPKVASLAANSDATYGFVVRNLKDISFAALDVLELAQFGSAMWMTAGAAITRGASLEVVYTTNKVITNAGVNPVIGYALDTAAADGDLIRVVIQAPYSAQSTNLTNNIQTLEVTATLAEINAGKVLIPAIAGQGITVVDYVARVTGTFTTGTNIIVRSNNGTPVLVTTIAEAGLTNGAVLVPASANTTLGAGFATKLGTGDALEVVSTGTQAAGTSVKFTITYKQSV